MMTRTMVVLSLLFVLAGCKRWTPGADLEWRHGRIRFNVDRINDKEVAIGKPIALEAAAGKPWVLCGWAIDAVAGRPATGVLGLIDGRTTLVAQYGTDRNDIADALHNPEYARTGFELHLENVTLAAGRHTLSLAILAADGRGYYRPDTEYTIEAR